MLNIRHYREKTAKQFFLLALMWLFLLPTQANAQKATMEWLIFDFAPIYIVAGQGKNSGFVDGMENYVKERLPQYRHKRTISNIKRLLAILKNRRQACASGLLWSPEQAEYIEYAIPSMFVFPAHFVIKSERLKSFKPLMNKAGELSLKKMLKESKLVLGYAKQRYYSTALAPIIKKYANENNSFASHRQAVTKPLLNMLYKGRFDYTIAFLEEVSYLSEELNIPSGSFITVPIAESNDTQFSLFGCPKSEWGRKKISEINAIIKDARYNPAFYNHYLKWLDEQSRNRYKKLIEKGFENHPLR
ncbi:MAG: TIGR02285 family protein [Magnetococcales bacterium]|nr:TIGR02285 family protein [Magnetococcales bacterium]